MSLAKQEQAAFLLESPFCQLAEIWLWLDFTAEAELACEFSLEKQNRCGWRWAGGGTGGPNQHSLLFAHSHTPAQTKKKKKLKSYTSAKSILAQLSTFGF